MLKNFLITFSFHRFCQSGFYFDFFYKKCSEVFVRNVFIYAAQFFGEKYLIEVCTKKIIDKFLFSTNKIVGWQNLQFSWFFIQILGFFFYFLVFVNLIYLFL